MGSKCAPAVACLFMGDFEQKHVYTYSLQPLIWLRYIDDIFLVWTHGLDELLKFKNHLNTRHDRVKFTMSYSPAQLEFLDTLVKLTNNKLSTELYTKPTSSLSYLKRESCHAPHVFSALPHGEFTRVRRNCSDLESFDRHAIKILAAFKNRGYHEENLIKAMLKARDTPRSELFSAYRQEPTGSQNETTERNFFCIMPYNPQNTRVRSIISNNWQMLGTSNITNHLYEKKVTYAHNRNPRLRDLLVRSNIPLKKPEPGTSGKRSHQCDRSDCIYCATLDTSGEITSFSIKKSFRCKRNVTCQSHNVVYCLECKTCGLQYVGMTKRTFHERLREHFRNITKNNNHDPIGRHWNSINHRGNPEDVKSYILSFITAPSDTQAALQMRLRFENQWVYRLRTSLPHGLNSMD